MVADFFVTDSFAADFSVAGLRAADFLAAVFPAVDFFVAGFFANVLRAGLALVLETALPAVALRPGFPPPVAAIFVTRFVAMSPPWLQVGNS